MQFRVKHPNGETRVVEVDHEAADGLEVLKHKAGAAFGFPANSSFELLIGQRPPQLLRGAGGESLSQLGLTEPQALLISELASKLAKKPSAAASAAKAAKKPRTIKKPRVATLADQGSEGDDDNDGDYQDEDEEVAKPKRKASRKKPSSKTPRTMEGLGEALASAHEVGGNTDPLAQHFRKLTKANVKLQYEIAASEARYSAVMRGEFEIFQSAVGSTHRLGDGQQMECKLLIKYRKEGAKSFVTEEVQGMGEELLRATVRHLLQQPPSTDPEDAFQHPREKLRAHALPMASPRVFWSLVHWGAKRGGEHCLTKALVALVPEQDWTFLDSRVRLPSAMGKQAVATEQAFAELEELEKREGEVQDGLSKVVPSWTTRDALRKRGVNSMHALALLDPESDNDKAFIHAAREALVDNYMQQLFPNAVLRQRIVHDMGFKTPLDVKRWSVPGRMNFVVSDLGELASLEQVREWQIQAESIISNNAWLNHAKYKTSG